MNEWEKNVQNKISSFFENATIEKIREVADKSGFDYYNNLDVELMSDYEHYIDFNFSFNDQGAGNPWVYSHTSSTMVMFCGTESMPVADERVDYSLAA